MILIDTNIISEYLKHDPDAGVKALFAAEPELALSVVTLEEMAYGLAWQPVPRVAQAFEQIVNAWPHVLPITVYRVACRAIAWALRSQRRRARAGGYVDCCNRSSAPLNACNPQHT